MRALLISTYDLGRQPFGLASGAAALAAHGVEVSCLDLAKQRLDEALPLLPAYWSGRPVSHSGPHYSVADVTLLPPTVAAIRLPFGS